MLMLGPEVFLQVAPGGNAVAEWVQGGVAIAALSVLVYHIREARAERKEERDVRMAEAQQHAATVALAQKVLDELSRRKGA